MWWTLPKAKTKNAKRKNATGLRVPLFGLAREVVARRLAIYPTGFLFPSCGKTPHIQQKVIGSAVWFHMPYSRTRPECNRPRLSVTHWAPHDLRRTVRTTLSALGCPEKVAEAVLGHMQGRYDLHYYDPERVEWLGKLNAMLTSLLQPADSDA